MFSTSANACVLSYISERDRERVGASGRSGGSGGQARPSGGSEEAKLPDGIRGSARDLVCFPPSFGIPVSPAGFSQVLASIRVQWREGGGRLGGGGWKVEEWVRRAKRRQSWSVSHTTQHSWRSEEEE